MTTVRESAAQRDGLFGALVVVFGLALVRGLTGASTAGGRIVVAIVFGALSVGGLIAGIIRRRRAPWLEVSDDSIELVRARSSGRLRLDAAAGRALRFTTIGSYRSRTLALTQSGGTVVLPLSFFAKARVREACTAHGWTFD